MIVNCAVCEIEIEARESFATIDDDGESYYLCSSRCLEDFEEGPELYGAWSAEEEEAIAARR